MNSDTSTAAGTAAGLQIRRLSQLLRDLTREGCGYVLVRARRRVLPDDRGEPLAPELVGEPHQRRPQSVVYPTLGKSRIDSRRISLWFLPRNLGFRCFVFSHQRDNRYALLRCEIVEHQFVVHHGIVPVSRFVEIPLQIELICCTTVSPKQKGVRVRRARYSTHDSLFWLRCASGLSFPPMPAVRKLPVVPNPRQDVPKLGLPSALSQEVR